jgi:dTDP-4-amino-4,6-dideoxygalactose transaminase
VSAQRPDDLAPWPPPPPVEFFRDLLALAADPSQGQTGPRAHAPLAQKRLFEQAFAAACGRRFAVAVSSGTTALDLAVEGLALDPGGVAVAADYGHPSTIREAARRHRLRFVDVDPETLCLSPEGLEAALAGGDVRVVLMTHVAGLAGHVDRIVAACEARRVPLVVDASHAHGAIFDGQPAGRAGTLACFSLHATKNLPCGEGGIICLDDDELQRRIWRLHDIGRDPEAGPYDFVALGGNFRMSEVAALEARHRLAALERDAARRQAAAARLIAALGESSCLTPLRPPPGDRAGWHFFPAWYRPERCHGLSRKRFVIAMSLAGVRCSTGWPRPLSEIPAVRPHAEPALTPVAARACQELVWLDGRLLLADDGVERVLAALDRVGSAAR